MGTLPRNLVTDLLGAGRLAADATLGVTGVVESMHGTIARGSPIAGLVYRSIRGVTGLIGSGADLAMSVLAPKAVDEPSSPRRETLLAILNGVYGDHLAATGNPLAIPMQLRRDTASLANAIPRATGRVVVLVHGLCMADLHWDKGEKPLSRVLARDLGYTSVKLHYNTGLHVSSNGREFAALLEELVAAWPVPVTELAIVGHSMGGLIARSAAYYGREAGHRWTRLLRSMVFLGTPHHGSPLERGGSIADLLLSLSPYSAPFARLAGARSAGIRDLRHGNLLDEDWQGRAQGHLRDHRHPVPLPEGVRCYAIAAVKSREPGSLQSRLLGDGLVPVKSALGQHRSPRFALAIPESQQWVGHGLGHLELMSNPLVHRRVSDWIGAKTRS